MPVELARVAAGAVRIDHLELPAGSTLGQALAQAVAAGYVTPADLALLVVAVNGLRKPPDHRLHPHERIELTGPLTVDPKVARQRRVAKRRAELPRDKWSPGR